MRRILVMVAAVIMGGCSSDGGETNTADATTDGTTSADGSDGTEGTDGGADGTDATDGTTSTDGTDGTMGGEPTSEPLESGLPDETTLADLTAEQVTQLCDAVGTLYGTDGYINDVPAAQCQIAGRDAALAAAQADPETDLVAVCQTAASECLQSAPDPAAAAKQQCLDSAQAVPAGCTATVADFEACAGDRYWILGEYFQQVANMGCEMLVGGEEPATVPEPPELDSCNQLNEKCSP